MGRTPHWVHSRTLANGRGGKAPRPQAKANCEVATATQSVAAVRVALHAAAQRCALESAHEVFLPEQLAEGCEVGFGECALWNGQPGFGGGHEYEHRC